MVARPTILRARIALALATTDRVMSPAEIKNMVLGSTMLASEMSEILVDMAADGLIVEGLEARPAPRPPIRGYRASTALAAIGGGPMSQIMTGRERPILFKGDMVRALLSGEKTQTRRLILPQSDAVLATCPHGKPGDRLWVREACAIYWSSKEGVQFKADALPGLPPSHPSFAPNPRFRPPFLMPRWASRITLGITDVRVQRIRSITDDDIRAEGIEEYILAKGLDPARTNIRAAWIDLWDSINGKREGGIFSWERNPWAWCITFRCSIGGGR